MTIRAIKNELIKALDDMIELLKKYNESHWAKWLEKDKLLIEKSDSQGIEHLLAAFGGMGSLNDLYICRENGHSIKYEEVKSVNNNIRIIKQRIFMITEEINRRLKKVNE